MCNRCPVTIGTIRRVSVIRSTGLVAEAKFKIRAPEVDSLHLILSSSELDTYVREKYGPFDTMGPSPALRYRRHFASADDSYECLISKMVHDDSNWLDVGCGRDLFPSNHDGARRLAARAESLVGIDPDDNVHQNDLLSDRFQGVIEDFQTDKKFNLVTLRMVAEHVVNADACVSKLEELTTSGGLVVIYTPWKWAPISIIASIVPFALHNRLKRLIWDSEEQDTFPTVYRMNTRKDLTRLFVNAQFEEVFFAKLDDCSVFTKYLWLNSLEISMRNLFLRSKLTYPEHCLLAVYRRT